MPTLYLILAHFIADFVLQPDRIVRMKHESWKGNLIHAGIHGATSIVIMIPFLPNPAILMAILIVTVSHFFIDSAKIQLEKCANKFVKTFLLDQSAHLLLISGAGYLLRNEAPASWFATFRVAEMWYLNPLVAAGLILIILATYGYELLLYQYARSKKRDVGFKPSRRRMVRNLFLFGVVYVLFLIFGVYSVAVTGM